MRPDVWMPFKERFGIPTVVEFFASTVSSRNCHAETIAPNANGVSPQSFEQEGNTFLFNYNVGYSKFGAGAIGREAFLSK